MKMESVTVLVTLLLEGNIFLIPHTDPRAFDAIKEVGSGKKKMAFSKVLRLTLAN